MESLRITCTDLARAALAEIEARRAIAEIGRRSFADFAKFAIAEGVVDGIKRVTWGPHLDRYCASLQFQLEGWIVAYGPDRDSEEWPAWEAEHAEMIARQRAAWEREHPVPVGEGEAPRGERPTWEDRAPEPWLRYVLVQNEIDNLPPGTLKSTLAMVLANAWIWLWAPAFAFGAASGMDANVGRDSKATRDLVKSSWYRETFEIVWRDEDLDDESTHAARESDRKVNAEREAKGFSVKRDSDAVGDWATSAGGKRRSRTLSSGFTGAHMDLTFVDDPDDADKVWSEAERLRPQNRWSRAIEDRVNCEHRSIRRVLQQRVHVEDFSAYLLSFGLWSPRNPKGWVWFCIPAEYGFQPADAPRETPYGPVDWRTEKGDLLHPRLSAGVLADKRSKRSAYEGPYNQNPDRAANGDFERRHARFFVFEGENPDVLRRRPEGCIQRVGENAQPPVVIRLDQLDRVTLSVDAANSLDPKPGAKISAVGLLVGGCRNDERYVLDDRTRVLGVAGTYRAIYEICAAWRLDTILVEVKALGNAVVYEIETSIKRGWYLDENNRKVELLGPDGDPVRCKVVPFNPGKDSKPQRAHGALGPWERGEIFLHDGASWLFSQVDGDRKTLDDGFIGEICGWPKARRNDRMDTLSQWLAQNRGKSDAKARWKAMARG